MHCCCGRLEPTFVKAYSRLAKGLVEPQSVLQAEAALEASLLLLSFFVVSVWFYHVLFKTWLFAGKELRTSS